MSDIYRGFAEQARFYQHSWDRVVSRVRPAGYGNPVPLTTSCARTIPLAGTGTARAFPAGFRSGLRGPLRATGGRGPANKRENEMLRERIAELLPKLERNRYNLEVFPIDRAVHRPPHTRMLMTLQSLEHALDAAQRARWPIIHSLPWRTGAGATAGRSSGGRPPEHVRQPDCSCGRRAATARAAR